MVIRFPFRSKSSAAAAVADGELRLESHPSGLNRTDSRRLSAREIAHRERMLRHLEQIGRAAQ